MFGNIGNIGRSLFGGIAPISNTLMLGGMGLMSGGDPQEQWRNAMGGIAAGSSLDRDFADRRMKRDERKRWDDALRKAIGEGGPLSGMSQYGDLFAASPELAAQAIGNSLSPADQPSSFDEWQLAQKYPEYAQHLANNPGGVNVNVNTGEYNSDDKLFDSLAGKEGERWSEMQQAGVVASGTQQDFEILDSLLTVAPQGPLVGRAAEMFPGFSTAGDAVESTVKRIAPTLRTPGSGSQSDIEYEGMLKSLPRLRNRPEANQIIAETMKAKAQINMERADVITAAQNREISANEARKRLAEINRRSIMTPRLKALLNATGAVDPSQATDEELLNTLGVQ